MAHAPSALVRRARAVQTLVQLRLKARTPPGPLGRWLAGRFHELGPTFVKVGQFISTRGDVFGAEFSSEFAHLRDASPPIPAAEVRAILARHLRDGVVESLEDAPLASASIGQVHRVRLAGGTPAIVKVKRPGVERVIREDVAFMRAALSLAEALGVDRNVRQAQDGLRDFEAYLAQEVDFRREAANLRRFHRRYRHRDDVVVPRVFEAMSDSDVLVMEYVGSECVTGAGGASGAKERRRAANRFMDVFVSQLVHDGLLHGDPHPGNVGLDARGRLVMYDFGNVIELSAEERMRLKELICMLLIGNNAGVVDTLRKLGVGVDDPVALSKYIDLYRDYMRTIDVSAIRAHHDPDARLPLRLTDKIMRIIRAFGILEGVCKQISDEFNYYDLLDNYVEELVLDRDFVAFKALEDARALASRLGAPPARAGERPPEAPPPPAARLQLRDAAQGAALWALLAKLAFFDAP